MAWRYCYKEVLPFAAVMVSECSLVGLMTLFKAASAKGMSFYIFTFYSFVAYTLYTLPLLFNFPSAAKLPSSKSPLYCRIFLLGLISVVAQISSNKGIAYSSPTLATAISNLFPAITFVLAIVFRMERLAIRQSSSQAKVVGTVVLISGALVVVLCKGPEILSVSSTPPSTWFHQSLGSSSSNWVIGGLLVAIEEILFAVWYIILAQVMKIYPAEITVMFFCTLTGTIVAAPICIIAEPDLNAWKLGLDVSLVAVLFSGVVGLCFILRAWVVRLKGPVYVAMFKPLSIVIAAFMSFSFLGEALHLGSVIGAIIICVGFYTVLWGKAKEETNAEDQNEPPSSAGKMPLLAPVP